MDKQRRAPVITEQRLSLAEQVRHDWVVNAEEGTTVQDIVDPGYWALIAARMTPYDRIEVRLETGEWVAELMVLQVDRTWAQVHVLHVHELASVSEAAPVPSKHRVVWKGPQHKHVIVRLSDNQPIKDGFSSKSEAQTWLEGYERTVATT